MARDDQEAADYYKLAPRGSAKLPTVLSNRPVTLVAHTIHDTGGMERAFAELIRAASDRVEFSVVATHLQSDLVDAVRWTRVRAPSRPVPLLLSSFAALASPYIRNTVGLLHTQGAITLSRPDVASVQFCHAAFQQLPADQQRVSGGTLRGLNRLLDQRLAVSFEHRAYRRRNPPLLLAASGGVQTELRAAYPGCRSRVVPNGVDLQRFRPPRAGEEQLRLVSGSPDCVALFVGGDWQRKGLPIAIEAIARARASSTGPDLRLVVVGGGDPEPMKARAGELGIVDAVSFVGKVTDPERYFRSADVFLFPTAYEAFPLVALEAAASGLPLIATAANGITDLVDETSGYVVERRAEDLAGALLEIARDAPRRKRLGSEARSRAEKYTWASAAALTLAAYDEAACA